MKILLILLFIGSYTYSQSKNIDSLQIKNGVASFFNYYNSNKIDTTFSLKPIRVKPLSQNQYFTSYNRVTTLNDNYIINHNSLLFIGSKKNLENDFRGNKIDSYNPYGASEFGAGVIGGVLGLFLDKIQ